MKRTLISLALCLTTGLVTGCGGSNPGGYDSDLNRKTAGAAVISGMAKMCGVSGIEQYRQALSTICANSVK